MQTLAEYLITKYHEMHLEEMYLAVTDIVAQSFFKVCAKSDNAFSWVLVTFTAPILEPVLNMNPASHMSVITRWRRTSQLN